MSSSLVDSLRARATFRHLAAATVGMTYLTIVLGVATKANGAGLACAARWPLCDGGLLNLLPASVPSFFEWIHRVVAGLTGFFILGTAYAAWTGRPRELDSRIRLAAGLALVLLPVQVLLGRATVLSFVEPVLMAHYWTAMTIFGAVVVTAALAWKRALTRRRTRAAMTLAVAMSPLQVLFSPQFATSYPPRVQTAHYVVTLVLLAGLLTAVAGGWRHVHDAGVAQYLAPVTLALIPLQIAIGRLALQNASELLKAVHGGVSVVVFVLLLAATAEFYRREDPQPESPGTAD